MGFEISPGLDRGFVPEERQRENFAGFGEALEAFDRNETVDLFQLRAQRGGNVEVFLLSVGFRPNLENDGYHLNLRSGATRQSPFVRFDRHRSVLRVDCIYLQASVKLRIELAAQEIIGDAVEFVA